MQLHRRQPSSHMGNQKVAPVQFNSLRERKLMLKPMRDIVCLPYTHPNESGLYAHP